MANQDASVYCLRPSGEFFTNYVQYTDSLMFEVYQNLFFKPKKQDFQGLFKLDMRPLLRNFENGQLYSETDDGVSYLKGVKYSNYWEEVIKKNLPTTNIQVYNPEKPVALSFTLGFLADV